MRPDSLDKERPMPRKKQAAVPRLVVPKNATLRQIYAKYRQEFTAADSQQYTEMEEGVPVEQILAEMEAIQRTETRRKKKT
jgi:hypothetical protein